MALIRCPDCGKEFSDAAAACPNCGRPNATPTPAPRKTGCFSWGCLAIIVLGIIGALSESGSHSPATPSADVSKYVSTSPAAAAAAAPSDHWTVERGTSKMDDSKSVTLSVDASGPISGWLATKVPSLYVRCREHKTNVFVVTGMAAEPELGEYDEYTVRLRLDDGSPFAQMWSESTDKEALFAPEAIALARRLARSKRLRFSFTPFNASHAIAEFDVTGLSTHLPELARTCGWSA